MAREGTTRGPHPAPAERARSLSGVGLGVYLAIGVYFGIVITKAELISWFRIQEMFRFQSFHMYGVILSAVLVAMASIALLKARKARTVRGDDIVIPPKKIGRGYRYWIGGSLFGLGWALAGACPSPMFALIGNGTTIYRVVLVSALSGTWLYGAVRAYLPHY